MRKIGLISICTIALLGGCSKQDPVLPGTRQPIFSGSSFVVQNKDISDLPSNASDITIQDCPYTQDSSNTIWMGDKKIFSGFPTANFVKSAQKPVCSDGFVYAGLTTGELVKVNPKTRDIAWLADVYCASNITGGAAVLDIVAPIIINKNTIYVGGLGDALCKLHAGTGAKIWCVDIGTASPFTVLDQAVFAVGTDNHLYAINTVNGDIYWRQSVKKQAQPIYQNKTIIVGKEVFDAKTGKPVK